MILLIALIPLVIAVVAWRLCHSTITGKEYLVMLFAGLLVAVCGYGLAAWGSLRSTEHWNGRITEKTHGSQSCCHCWTVCDSHDKDGNCTSSHEEC